MFDSSGSAQPAVKRSAPPRLAIARMRVRVFFIWRERVQRGYFVAGHRRASERIWHDARDAQVFLHLGDLDFRDGRAVLADNELVVHPNAFLVAEVDDDERRLLSDGEDAADEAGAGGDLGRGG